MVFPSPKRIAAHLTSFVSLSDDFLLCLGLSPWLNGRMSAVILPRPATGLFAGGTHYFPARVYFEDTDLSGVVYHANYLRYMERARSDMLRLAGIDQRGNHEGGEGVYAVADLSIAYRRPARLDDDLLVKSRVTAVGAATCTIHQSVTRDDDILTEGSVTAAFLSPSGRPKRQPKAWIEIFNALSLGEETTA